MALGGLNGTDPSLSLAQFKQYVADEIKSWGSVVRSAGLTVN